MPAPNPMPIGLALVMVRGMESAMGQDIGAIHSATTASPMGPMGQRDSDGMADMEASARPVRRLLRRGHGRPYLPIRHRGLEKATEVVGFIYRAGSDHGPHLQSGAAKAVLLCSVDRTTTLHAVPEDRRQFDTFFEAVLISPAHVG